MQYGDKMRARRAHRRDVLRRQTQLMTFVHSTPCCMGDAHQITIVLRKDGSLLSVHSECWDNPPTDMEIAIANALADDKDGSKFFTCADFVEDVLLAARVKSGFPSSAGQRNCTMQHFNPGYPSPARQYYDSLRDKFAKEHGVQLVFAVIDQLIKTKSVANRREERPWDPSKFRYELRRQTLRCLEKHDIESSDDTPKKLGHHSGLEFGIHVEGQINLANIQPDDQAARAIFVTVREASYGHAIKVAKYVGKGRFKVDFEAIELAAAECIEHATKNISTKKRTCRICGQMFTGIAAHAKTQRHRQQFQSVVLSTLTTIGERISRKD